MIKLLLAFWKNVLQLWLFIHYILYIVIYYCANKGPYNQGYGFSSSNVWMWELDHKEGWPWKNWCFWTVVLEKTQSPLDCKEIKLVNPKGNQPWILIGRNNAEAEALYFGHLMWRTDSLKKTHAGKDCGQEEKQVTEDEMVGWYHRCNGHELGKIWGDGEGQGSLTCSSLWDQEQLAQAGTEQQWTRYTVHTVKSSLKCNLNGFIIFYHVTILWPSYSTYCQTFRKFLFFHIGNQVFWFNGF